MMRSVKTWKKFYEELEESMPEEIYWEKEEGGREEENGKKRISYCCVSCM